MKININERFRPFSHLPGTVCVLPKSGYKLQVFPSLIKVFSFVNPEILHSEIFFSVQGPLKEFTILQDLERGQVVVWGDAQDGFFRYTLLPGLDGKGIALHVDKAPEKGVKTTFKGKWQREAGLLKGGSRIDFEDKDAMPYLLPTASFEKLSLGNSKTPDWELIRRRGDMREIFPLWFLLGQQVPQCQMKEIGGTLALLQECEAVIQSHSPEKILPAFNRLFLAGFDFAMSPRICDSAWQGIVTHEDRTLSPLPLLSKGKDLIRQLFFYQKERVLHILPNLPPQFSCGRFLNVSCGSLGMAHLEWSKKSIKKVIFSATASEEVIFKFNDQEKSCRVRTSHKDSGRCYQRGELLAIQAGQNYWFDNFRF